jgi:D-alanyl-D-alanine carboxypeptidase
MMLIDDGLVNLDTTVNEVLPELNIVMDYKITIRNLLEMRSGLGKYLGNEDFAKFLIYDPEHVFTPEELVAYFNYKVSEPGTDFLYNNGNFVLLGLMIEKLTSMAYDQAVDTYILNPLHLTSTYLPINLNMPDSFAYGYEYDYDANISINKTYYLNPTMAWSAGGFISNADDLLIWAKAYTDGDLISDSLYEEQFTFRDAENNIGIDAYGLGLMKYGYLVGHDGFIPPYGSWLATYKGYKFVLLMNGTGQVAIPALVASYVLTDIIDMVDSQL